MKHSESERAVTDIILRILELYGVLYAQGERITRPFGQSPARWQILGAIEHDALTVSQIARRIGTSRQAVQRITDDMVAAGLIEYAQNPDHARSPKVSFTASGRRVYDRINETQSRWAARIGAELNASSLRAATKTLDDLQAALAHVESSFFGTPAPQTKRKRQ